MATRAEAEAFEGETVEPVSTTTTTTTADRGGDDDPVLPPDHETFEEFLDYARLYLTYELYPANVRSPRLSQVAEQAAAEKWGRLRLYHERRNNLRRLRVERVARYRALRDQLNALYTVNRVSPEFRARFERRFRAVRVNTVRACIIREHNKWQAVAIAILGRDERTQRPVSILRPTSTPLQLHQSTS